MSEPSIVNGPKAASGEGLTADTIRVLAMDAVEAANSGHPGMPMGMADAATALWVRHLKFDPAAPDWPDRDRFVLSAGHGSMLLYALLHLSGYDLPLSELKRFRQWGSKTAGHPEYGHAPGIETTTGPLGQGISNSVGLALAERWMAARFNRPDFPVVDHRTFTIASDGDLMEGVSHEACALAGHLGLSRLTVLYDDNHISIDGPTKLSFSEDVLERFAGYGWHVQRVDGHKPKAVSQAIEAAIAEDSKPSIIACRTIIGHGSPNRAGTAKAHGEPLGAEEVKLVKEKLGWPTDSSFLIPDGARQPLTNAAARGAKRRTAWNTLFEEYARAHPELAAQFQRAVKGDLPEKWDARIPQFEPGKGMATRASSGKTLDAIIGDNPDLLGGSADLTGSNKTLPAGVKGLAPGDFSGQYIYYGVREHGMGAIMNGLALHGGAIPYGGTFLVFSDYMRPSIRLAALMGLGTIYVFTHDSIGLGEDGPTHQPIEHLAALRAIPNLAVVRPGDANETASAWRIALERRHAPTALVLTRQNLPTLEKSKTADAIRGGYVLSDAPGFKVILMATGSEVEIVLKAQQVLKTRGVPSRVVSLPCWERFEEQDAAYRDTVLPPSVIHRVAVEAASPFGWERYVGSRGKMVGLDHYGASAPYETLYQEFGLTAEAVAAAALELLG